tara:strand:- start:117 stop:293 length:177 start_codon:yes stop_codon:yes gene_type:complete
MTAEQKYKVIIEETNGWFTYDKNSQNLTRAEGIKWVDDAMKDGISPDRLRVVRQEWGT